MRSAVHQRGPARLVAGITPMIDLTFLLVVFFVLVAQISERDRVTVDLPRPDNPASAPAMEERRATLTLIPDPDDLSAVAAVRLGGVTHRADDDGRAALAAQIASIFRESPNLRLQLRADRRAEYRDVEPVLAAVTAGAASAGVLPRVNLVVIREP